MKLGPCTLYSCNDGKEISKRSVIHVQSFRFADPNLSLFGRCRRRCCCLSSPLSRGRGAGGGGGGGERAVVNKVTIESMPPVATGDISMELRSITDLVELLVC